MVHYLSYISENKRIRVLLASENKTRNSKKGRKSFYQHKLFQMMCMRCFYNQNYLLLKKYRNLQSVIFRKFENE